MTTDGSSDIPSVVRERLMRAERRAALIGLPIAVLASVALVVMLGSAARAPWVLVAAGIGLGCLAAMAVLTIWSFTLIMIDFERARADPAESRAIRRAVLSGDTAALNPVESAYAPRWAAIRSLQLREQIVNSVLVVAGIGSLIVAPGIADGDAVLLYLVLAGILVGLLIVSGVLVAQQRKLHRFAARAGAWDAPSGADPQF